MVFYVAAAVYTFGAIVYVVGGAGEVQSWAMPIETDIVREVTSNGQEVAKDPDINEHLQISHL